MKTHIKSNHEEVTKDELLDAYWESDQEQTYSLGCGNCEFETNSKKYLNLHIDECQDLKYKCDQCNFNCKTAGLLKRHRNQKH